MSEWQKSKEIYNDMTDLKLKLYITEPQIKSS